MTDLSNRNEQSKELLQQYEELRNLMVRMRYDMERIQETQKNLIEKEDELSERIEALMQQVTAVEKHIPDLTKTPTMSPLRSEPNEEPHTNSSEISADSPLVQFFQAKGLEVVDKRPSNGALWITGDADILESAVEEAQKTYHVNGTYGTGRAIHQQPGWYTKSKK